MEEEENLVFSGRYTSGSNSDMEMPLPEVVEEEEEAADASATIVSHDESGVETSSLPVHGDDVVEEEPEMAETIASSSRTSKKSKEDEEMEHLGGALVWPLESNNRPPGYSCYTSEQWSRVQDKKLFYTGKLTLISKLLWVNSYDDAYRIAIYQRPATILILKQQPPSLFGGNRQPVMLTVEAVLDPAVCKLKLSHWTTPSSVYHSKHSQLDLHESCFELVSPTHTWIFSVLPPLVLKSLLPSDPHSGVLSKSDQDRWTSDTFMWEAMLSQALLQLHVATMTENAPQARVSPNQIIKDCYSWRHAVILGTLHSYVVTCDKELLHTALSQTPKVNVNEIDEYGFTPLHYACNQRDTSAVRLLVKAGADPTIPLVNTEFLLSSTCSHISAANLDCQTLSVLLSSTHEPNVLDEYGRTPMYIAAVEGTTVNPNNPQANLSCLSATLRTLQNCGGRYMVGDPSNSTSSVPHPVWTLSHRWDASRLSIVLSHDSHTSSLSLGTLYQYPLHIALISLRKTITEELNSLFISNTAPQQRQNQDVAGLPAMNYLSISSASPRVEEESLNTNLSGTLRALLNHGLEPNERYPFLSMDDELYLQYHSCTPLQILAICALDVSSATHMITMTESQNLLVDNFLEQIAFAAEVLTYCGARIHSITDPPPAHQPGCQAIPSTREPNAVSLLWKKLAEFQNEHFLNLMGGKERLLAAWTSWTIKGSITAPSVFELRCKPTSDDSIANGCTVCWKPFGKLRSRKHWCRSSHCYVCDDCSSKRVIKFGEQLRVSDGQYLLASFLNAQQSSVDASTVDSKNDSSKANLSLATSRKPSSLRSSSAEEAEEEREELFSGFSAMGKTMMNFFNGVDQGEEGSMSGLTETLGQTKDALLERGSKLSSLSEKTSALADSSREFAALAKALKESQQKANSGFFW